MACPNIFKTTEVIDDTKKHNELYSRTVNDDYYYWFAKQTGNKIAKFSNGNTICTRPSECVHHAKEVEDFPKNSTTTTVASLSNIETILHRYNGKCCILINEEDDHMDDKNYILIDTDNSDDNSSSYVEEDEDNNSNHNNSNDDNIKFNENNHPYHYDNNRKESSTPKCSKN